MNENIHMRDHGACCPFIHAFFKKYIFHLQSLCFSKVMIVSLIAAISMMASPSFAQKLQMPDCSSIEQWSAHFVPKEMVRITPKYKVHSFLRAELTKPLFGKAAKYWTLDEFRAVIQSMTACRNAANARRDQKATIKLALALRRVKKSARVIRDIERSQARAERNVQGFVDHQETPGLIDVILFAQQALRGENVQNEVQIYMRAHRAQRDLNRLAEKAISLQGLYAYTLDRRRDVLIERLEQRKARIVAGLVRAAEEAVRDISKQPASQELLRAIDHAQDVLEGRTEAPLPLDLATKVRASLIELRRVQPNIPKAKAKELVARLQEQRTSVQASVKEQEAAARKEVAAAKKKLESIPVSEKGAEELNRLIELPALAKLPEEDAARFRKVVLKRLEDVRQELRKQKKAEQEKERQEAMAQLQEAKQELMALPAAPEALRELNRLARLPALEKVPEMESRRFLQQINAKRRSIRMARQRKLHEQKVAEVQEMIDEIKAYQVEEPKQLEALLKKMVELTRMGDDRSYARAMRTLGFGRNEAKALWGRFETAAKGMLPAFRRQLQAIPATQEGLQRLSTAVPDLTGISARNPPMEPYYEAVKGRSQEIAYEIRRTACEKKLDAAGISRGEAEQAMWGSGKATTLGDFMCKLAESGNELHEYDAGGFFSDTHTLKLTSDADGFHTIKLHEAEVRPGQEMLIGFEISDANQVRELSVKDWEEYVMQSTRQRGGSAACDRLANKPQNELSLQERMTLMNCIMQQAVRAIEK